MTTFILLLYGFVAAGLVAAAVLLAPKPKTFREGFTLGWVVIWGAVLWPAAALFIIGLHLTRHRGRLGACHRCGNIHLP